MQLQALTGNHLTKHMTNFTTDTDSMHTALMFPGQGSQQAGMEDVVREHRPDLWHALRRRLGADVFARVEDGTSFQQPAIYCASLALYEAHGCPAADAMTGHSLGEIAALTAAGALGADDGLELVCERARLMHRAGTESAGGLLAVIGPRAAAKHLAVENELEIANENAPEQLVLAGAPPALERAQAEAPCMGLRSVRLNVSGAFHSSAMASAQAELARALAEVEIRRPRVPVYSGVTARPFEDVRVELVQALTGTVRWQATVTALHREGVRDFIEIGPGRVLTGLVRRTIATLDAREAAEGVLVGV